MTITFVPGSQLSASRSSSAISCAAFQRAIDDDQVRRRAIDVVRDRRRNAAHVHADVRLGQPAIFGGVLQSIGNAWFVAEGLDRNARNRTGAVAGMEILLRALIEEGVLDLVRGLSMLGHVVSE